MKKIKILATMCMLLSAYSNLYSFDGDRNGFILGGGIGGGYLSNSFSYESYSKTDNRGVFLTNFKIGYAPSNTLEVYYISKVSWWAETDMTYALGLSAIAVTFYTDTKTETGLSVSGGLGLSTLSAPFGTDYESSNGFGAFGGAGYEFTNHWSVEFDVLYSAISESGVDLNSFGVQLTINVLAY
jgi:Outer membrane protein beta-barrel domain